MSAQVTLVGAAAVPCGRIQSPRDAAIQSLEHEMLARCVIEALRDSGLPKDSIGALVFSHPRPYTQQRYFGTFMANYLRIKADGVLMEVIGNGMTGGLAFDQAAQAVASGRADVALALGVNFETGTPSRNTVTFPASNTPTRWCQASRVTAAPLAAAPNAFASLRTTKLASSELATSSS